MRLLLRTAIAVSLFVASASAAQIALPTPLNTLVGTDNFVVDGDLTFDSFAYAFTADMPPAKSINVIATVDGDGHSEIVMVSNTPSAPWRRRRHAHHRCADPLTQCEDRIERSNYAVPGKVP